MSLSTPTFRNNIIQLNLSVLLISTSGVLGRYIDLPVITIIFGRAIVGAACIFLFCRFVKISLSIEPKDRWKVLFAGVFLGIHWLSYFIALKQSSVSIAMLSMYSFPVITTILEPLLLKTKFQVRHIFLGILAFVGIYFLIPQDVENTSTISAISWGVLSGFTYSLRNIIMKIQVGKNHGSTLMFYQLVIVSVMLVGAMPLMDNNNFGTQWPYILILGLVTTAIGHTLFLFSFKRLSASTVSLLSSVQPVYGIILAILILAETPSIMTIIGGVIILSTVAIESVLSSRST